MEDVFYDKSQYIETQSGNKVSRQSVLCGSNNIVLAGKTIIQSGCIIRGDLANVRIGRQCLISSRSVIRPPGKELPSKDPPFMFLPLSIGDFVTIEEDCVVGAAQIGSYVTIGKGSVIGPRCILKDCCRIAENTVLPPDTIVPPFCLFGGVPGKMVEQLPECAKEIHHEQARTYYTHFKPKPVS